MQARLRIQDDSFQSHERLIAHDLGNALLNSHVHLQQHFGLRAEVMQVLLLIVLATVQKLTRQINSQPKLMGNTPVPTQFRGGISRRQIAANLGIPIETVWRHVDVLVARGLVEERRRGCLSTKGGTLKSLSEFGLPRTLSQYFLRMINSMIQREDVRQAMTR